MREQISIQLAKELFAGTRETGFICHVHADIAISYPETLAVITSVKYEARYVVTRRVRVSE